VLELLDLMADNVSLTTGEVDQKKLEQAIMKKSRQTFTKTSKREDPQAESQLRRFNTLKQNGFSENDVLLIQESENNAPIAFLKAIKAEKNSFMTDSEQWLIKSLVERSPLPNSVINVLVHYVLVVQNNAALSGNYVNNIAAQWSELKIGTAEDAIKHVRSLVRSAKEKRSRPQTSGKKIIREEKLPSWAEKPVEETALTPERQAELDKKLQNYLHKKAGDK
jgi:replication initiation and membrane attachment protein